METRSHIADTFCQFLKLNNDTMKYNKLAKRVARCASVHFQMCMLFVLFICCCFTSQVNSYGHGGMVSSPSHTFSWASLNKQLTSTTCTYFRL